jgi:hypothetical protein
VYDTDLLAQSSIYDPNSTAEVAAPKQKKVPTGKRDTVVRKGFGKTWEDPTLVDWDPSEYPLANPCLFRPVYEVGLAVS